METQSIVKKLLDLVMVPFLCVSHQKLPASEFPEGLCKKLEVGVTFEHSAKNLWQGLPSEIPDCPLDLSVSPTIERGKKKGWWGKKVHFHLVGGSSTSHICNVL